MSLFSSTAEFYGAYRSDVPASVATLLSEAAPSGSPRRLLDVGTGTGFVIRALLPVFDEAIGVDVDTDLLAIARHDLEPHLASGRVDFFEAAAEDFSLRSGWLAQLVTVCRAFHWFDRSRFLEHAAQYLAPGGTIAIFGDRSVWAANAPWKSATLEVVHEFLGQGRRAGEGSYRMPARDYAVDLEQTGYRDIRRQTVPVTRSRSIESVIGYLHSTSFASLAVLGDDAAAFDDRLRERLQPHIDAAGLLHDENEFSILTATR